MKHKMNNMYGIDKMYVFGENIDYSERKNDR